MLYIDNMDELRHHYRTDEERQKARRDTEVLLMLRNAPVVLVLNMRTYYSGILPREIANRRVLRPLREAELLLILEKRLEAERHEVRMAIQAGPVKEATRRLAAIAPTPLAFLTWFKALFEEKAMSVERVAGGVTRFLETYYSTVPEQVWRKVVEAFDDPEECIDRDKLIAACDGNAALFNQAVDRQGVLPKDFWDPSTYFTLDPELFLVHPKRSLLGSG